MDILSTFKDLLSKSANKHLQIKKAIQSGSDFRISLGDGYDFYNLLLKNNGDVIMADDKVKIGNVNDSESLVAKLAETKSIKEMSSTGGGSSGFSGSTGEGVATKNAFKKSKPFTKSLSEGPVGFNNILQEMTYHRFKNEAATRTKSQQLHRGIKEVHKKLKEINTILEYASRMRSELNEGGEVKYNRFTENTLSQINEMAVKLYGNIKKLKK